MLSHLCEQTRRKFIMAKITLNIEAETVQELQDTLKGLQKFENLPVNGGASGFSEWTKEAKEKVEAKKEERTEKVTKPNAEKKKPAEKEVASSDSTSETKNSIEEKPHKLYTDDLKKNESADDEPETSVTPNKYPEATMEDVRAAVKKALENKKRNEVRTALERQNVSKVPDLDPANYGVFLTDLEVLVGD